MPPHHLDFQVHWILDALSAMADAEVSNLSQQHWNCHQPKIHTKTAVHCPILAEYLEMDVTEYLSWAPKLDQLHRWSRCVCGTEDGGEGRRGTTSTISLSFNAQVQTLIKV